MQENIQRLQEGATLLKCGRSGRPHFRPFRLTPDSKRLAYKTPKKKEGEEYVILSQVNKIEYGQVTPNFKKSPLPDYAHLSFSLVYGDRTLDLVAKDEEEFRVWYSTLAGLTLSRDYHSFLATARTKRSASARQGRSSKGSKGSSKGSRGSSRRKARADGGKSPAATPKSTRKGKTGGGGGEADARPGSMRLGPASGETNERVKITFKGRRAIIATNTKALDVYSWGDNAAGQLGHGTEADQSRPRLVEALLGLDIVRVIAGDHHSLVITSKGDVMAFGSGSHGQLGLGDNRPRSTPTLIATTLTGKTIQAAAAGEAHSLVMTDDGRVYSFGSNSHGQLGHGDIGGEHQFTPRLISSLAKRGIIAITAGVNGSAALTASGDVYVWGDNESGSLGVSGTRIGSPTKVSGLPPVNGMSIGAWHSLFVTESGSVWASGDGTSGRLGLGPGVKSAPHPVEIGGEIQYARIVQTAVGYFHSIALTDAGEVYGWGAGDYGQTGTGSTTEVWDPVKLTAIGDQFIEYVATGSSHTALVSSTGLLFTFGYGFNGRLGHGDTSDRLAITKVSALEGKEVHAVATSGGSVLASVLHTWVPDKEADACMSCAAPFTFINRRHHCRQCGGLFDAKCSAQTTTLLNTGTIDPVRVCDACFDDIAVEREAAKTRLATLVGTTPAAGRIHNSKLGLSAAPGPSAVPSGRLTRTGSRRAPPSSRRDS